MIKKNVFIRKSKQSKNNFAQSWAYYPPEFSCANKDKFEFLEKCKKYRQMYTIDGKPDFNMFIQDVANTFDSYCLGLALCRLMTQAEYKEKKFFLEESYWLFKEFSDENLMDRDDSIKSLESRYRELLKKYGMYEREKPTPSPQIIQEAETLSLNSDIFGSIGDNVKADRKKACPPKAPDYNPKTKKCVKACQTGKIRNDKFRCVNPKRSIKKRGQISIMKDCREQNKDFNPITKRCIKKCKPNYTRNMQMKCVSTKTRKRRVE